MSNKESNKENYNQKEVLDTTDEIKSYVKVEANTSQKSKHTDNKLTDKKELDNKKVGKRKVQKKETAKKNTTKNNETKTTVSTEGTTSKDTSNKKDTANKKESPKKDTTTKTTVKTEITTPETTNNEVSSKEVANKAASAKQTSGKETAVKETTVKETPNKEVNKQEPEKKESTPKHTVPTDKLTPISGQHVKDFTLKALKVVLPVAACAIFAATIISFVGTRNRSVSSSSIGIEESESISTLIISEDPLQENAYADVNELMTTFYKALSDGDMDTVRALRDYNDDTEILQYQTKSAFIESYDNITCYTKPGISSDSYFVYVSYDVKVEGVDTKAPGLNAFYVYTNDDGNLIIDGNMADDITAAFKLVTNQDDVVDLYNRIDVDYKDAIASDEQLNAFMTDLPAQIKTAVGEALAQLEVQNSESNTETSTETSSTEEASATGEVTTNQTVNDIVRTTDTVNVRSSDSETADKLGKAAVGTEITRTEVRANGWSKVIYEGKEAYIKSDYLELVSSSEVASNNTDDNTNADETTITTDDTATTAATTTETVTGKVKALTNVNVRSAADQNSTKLGTAVAENTFDLLGVEGDWYKIKFNGSTGYAKAEFFQKQ